MSSQARIIGIDVARALALLGMVVAHVIDKTPGDGAEIDPWFQLVAGRSSALFAVLAGVSIVLSTRARAHANLTTTAPRPPNLAAPGDRARLEPIELRDGARRSVAIRAALIAAIGLVLGIPDVGVAVILVYYGALFCCAIPVLQWRARSLIILAICWGLASPAVSMLIRPVLPDPSLVVPEPSSLLNPFGLLIEISVTGYYPVLTWATYLFAGMALGRLNLRSAGVARRMLLLGLGLAASALGPSALLGREYNVRTALIDSYDITGTVSASGQLSREVALGFFGTTPTGSWWWLGIWAPHSGSIVDLAHTTGCAVAVLGAVLLVTHELSPRGRRVAHIVCGAGTMTLTLYAVHIALLAAPADLGLTQAIAFHVVVLGSLGALFVASGTRGPLELAVGLIASPATDSAADRLPSH